MEILVATGSGCRVFTAAGESRMELTGRAVNALASEVGGTCLAVVEGQEIRRRSIGGEWAQVATTDIALESILSNGGIIYGGASAEAAMLSIPAGGEAKRLTGFDDVPGRREWFANGPPLHVRSLTATADGAAILAAVHVGGISRSSDQGQTWTPTIPIAFDVHEVCAHPSMPNLVAAAAAAGLCLSHDGGRNWNVLTEGLTLTNSLAMAVLEDTALFSIQMGRSRNVRSSGAGEWKRNTSNKSVKACPNGWRARLTLPILRPRANGQSSSMAAEIYGSQLRD
jgi:hypothetical protein